jgi:uncharacterized membrane protein YtjA (UPF0391 family)
LVALFIQPAVPSQVRFAPASRKPIGALTAKNEISLDQCVSDNERIIMLGWSIMFLIIALVAGVLGFAGIAGTAAAIAKVLFVIFLVLFLVSLIAGRRRV